MNVEHCIITSEATRIPKSVREGNAYMDDPGNRRFRGTDPIRSSCDCFEGVYSLDSFPGRFWWVEVPPLSFRLTRYQFPPAPSPSSAHTHTVVSTDELAATLACGTSVFIHDGPFDSRDAAHYALDVACEAPE